jgi:hypothetical protein
MSAVKDRKGEELLKTLARQAKAMKLTVWQWKPGPVAAGHAGNSYHYQTYRDGVGKAFDAYGSLYRMWRYARWINKHAPQVTEGIHNPGLSRKNGQRVSSSYWGPVTWRAHRNHVHVACA